MIVYEKKQTGKPKSSSRHVKERKRSNTKEKGTEKLP